MRLPICILVVTLVCVSTVVSQPSREITRTVALKPDGLVYIDTYKGSITVTTYR